MSKFVHGDSQAHWV